MNEPRVAVVLVVWVNPDAHARAGAVVILPFVESNLRHDTVFVGPTLAHDDGVRRVAGYRIRLFQNAAFDDPLRFSVAYCRLRVVRHVVLTERRREVVVEQRLRCRGERHERDPSANSQ